MKSKSMKKPGLFLLVIMFIVAMNSCKRNEIDIDKLSDWTAIQRELAMPLVKGNITVAKLVENDEDSVLVIDGDTVKMFFTVDSVIDLSIDEILDIPSQVLYPYLLSSELDIDLTGIPAGTRLEDQDSLLVNDTIFTLNLSNSIRIDRVELNAANIFTSISNGFNHEMTLIITSTSLIDQTGNFFLDSITGIPPGGVSDTVFNLDNYTINTILDTNNNSAITVKFEPVIIKGTDDFIPASDAALVAFGVDEISDFKTIYGFFGYHNEAIDTILDDFAPESLEGLSGYLNVTDPKLRLHYNNSIGVSADLTMELNLYHENDPTATLIDLGTQTLLNSDDPQNPEYLGNFLYDESTVDNIDSLIAFPMPEIINAKASASVNAGADSATTNNWAIKESGLLIDVEVEVPMEFRADLTYSDTIKISERNEDEEQDDSYEVEYANLFYKFRNYFPIGFGGDIIVYDSINDINLGVIDLNPDNGGLLLNPAPVDANGNVQRDQVQLYEDSIELDPSLAEDILTIATHLIFSAQLSTTDFSSSTNVRIGVSNNLEFQFGIEAKGKYYTE
jgi:hypothetical protein